MSTLRSSLFAILAILIALGAIEGIAYWWMHPAPAGLGEPVLAYRPVGRDPARSAHLSPAARDDHDQQPGVGDQEEAPAPDQEQQSSSSNQKSKINNHQSEISSTTTYTPLPELVSHAIPSLRCSTGTVARIDRDDGVTIHVAFFEWDLSSSINVLEAYKHLPEQCMGSIGMTLIEKAPPRSFVVRSQRTEVREQGTGDRGQEEATTQSSSSNQQSAISNQQSTIPPSSAGEILSFDHTVFRDPVGRPVHAFKGVWVSGAANLLGDNLRGGEEQWRQIRFQAALKRFRPAHARVAQGAILGIANPDRAWEIFEESMLRDLAFQR